MLQQARTLASPHDNWAALRRTPGGAGLARGPWAHRYATLAAYREALHTSHADPDAVLHALLAAHLRLTGEASADTAWRVARSIALADTRPRHRQTP